MIDDVLHADIDRWLAKSSVEQDNNTTVLRSPCAAARMRYIGGAVHIANITVKPKYRRQGVFTGFLAHCEETGRAIVVENVENEHLQKFMSGRPGYIKRDTKVGGRVVEAHVLRRLRRYRGPAAPSSGHAC